MNSLSSRLALDDITRAAAATLRDEGAASFVKSWNELMWVVASKPTALEKIG
jgi:hypothetical protein